MNARKRVVALVGALALVVPSLAVAVIHDVTIDWDTFAFNPINITIQKGDIVRWTNNTDFSHTTTSGPGSCTLTGLWNAQLNFNGAQFSRVFNENPGNYPYFCIPHCLGGMRGNVIIQSPPSGIEPPEPPAYKLYQNAPNPFGPTTTIEYEITKTARVEIEVYSIQGQRLGLIENDVRAPGRYPVIWEGTDEQQTPQATGVYFYQMKVDGVAVEMKKMVLIR